MSGVKNGRGAITYFKNEMNGIDKDNPRAGMGIAAIVEKRIKEEIMKQDVVRRSEIIEEKEVVDSVDLARELRAEMEEEPVL